MTKRRRKQANSQPAKTNKPVYFNKPIFQPLNDEQAEAYRTCRRNTITFLTGPAGCSKTFTAIAYAVDSLLAGQVERIYIARPAIEACGESLGFLPGTANEKLANYLTPIFDCLRDYVGEKNPLLDEIKPNIHITPLAYLRGRTLKHCVAILDEAQNANMDQLEMFATRLGEGSRMVLCGDSRQSDILRSPLDVVASIHNASPEDMAQFNFSQESCIIRHELTPHIIDCFTAAREQFKQWKHS